MQSTSATFRKRAAGYVRPVYWQLRASFSKTIDPSIVYFILDDSLLDGPDILSNDNTDVLAEWDQYLYTDYSSRVISIETTREVLEPYSIVQSFADVTLNNYDSYFTPNSGSPIDEFILPGRPMRIFMGFGSEAVQTFVGISEKMPTINKQDRTATFHLVDFMSVVLSKKVDETELLLDKSTTEILEVLFAAAGLLPNQYELEEAFNRVPFFYVEKGQVIGDIIKELMQDEQGRLFMDELGVLRFYNRQSTPPAGVMLFNENNTIDYDVSTEDDIINKVRININVLEVLNEQSIWSQVGALIIPAGGTKEVWANLNDPVTNVTTPVYSDVTVESSHFITTTNEDGSVPYTDISLNSIDVFGKSIKLIFENTGSFNAYVYSIDLWGTPVKQVDEVLIEDEDETSIAKHGERLYEYTAKYIQDTDNALSKAALLIDDYKEYGSIIDLEVKGNPALQLDDSVTLALDGYSGLYSITKIVNILSGGRFQQRLRAKTRTARSFFTLDNSLMSGPDVLAP